MTSSQKSIVSLVVVHLLGGLFALGLSSNSTVVFGVPSPVILVAVAFSLQWLMFIPAFVKQTESFFDLTGSVTYLCVVILGLAMAESITVTHIVVAVCTMIWAVRLGYFLFTRIRQEGKDGRFDDIKPSFFRFLNVWSIQGLWVTITSAAVILTLTSRQVAEVNAFFWIGLLVWCVGFAIEAIADHQKKIFRVQSGHKGQFIRSGLWSISRHPNYLGEIMLWTGIAIIALPLMIGWQWLALMSPAFVFLLLNFVSGIPLLEKRADERWGADEAYRQYKASTPVLVPSLKALF